MTADTPPRVLLVDDDLVDVRFVRELLGDFPVALIELEAASSLSEAFVRLHEERFDAVLLDLGLPDSRHIETLRKTRLAAPDLPIVVLTSNRDADLPLASIRNGAQDYLVKGAFDALMLSRTIRHAVERMQALQSLIEAEDRYRELYERVDCGILELDAEGRVSSVNPALMRILGCCSSSDLVGLRLDAAGFFESEDFARRLVAARSGTPQRTTLRLRTARGEELVSPCDIYDVRSRDGKLLGYQAMLNIAGRGGITESRRH